MKKTSIIIAAAMAAAAATSAQAQSFRIPPEQMARMCDDLRVLAREGDAGARRTVERDCDGKGTPDPVRAQVEIDPVVLRRAQDCRALQAKADRGDPVAKYDFVKAHEAGLCRFAK